MQPTGALTIFSSTVTIRNSNFTLNNHPYGGAIFFQGNSHISISESNFLLNNAFIGGAIYFKNVIRLSLINNTFEKNNATLGGGIYYTRGVQFYSVDNFFLENSAQVDIFSLEIAAGGAAVIEDGDYIDENNVYFGKTPSLSNL